jgi:hypothetical protein
VRAIGRPEIDETGQLAAFSVTQLVPAPDIAALKEQGKFFERHELTVAVSSGGAGDALEDWAIGGLTPEERDNFLDAIADR